METKFYITKLKAIEGDYTMTIADNLKMLLSDNKLMITDNRLYAVELTQMLGLQSIIKGLIIDKIIHRILNNKLNIAIHRVLYL